MKSREPKKTSKPQEDWEVNGVRVSDHAVVRYLENEYGIDAREIREAMLAQGRGAIIRKLKTCKVPINGSGAKLIARDGCIVTVTKREYPSTTRVKNGNGNGTTHEL